MLRATHACTRAPRFLLVYCAYIFLFIVFGAIVGLNMMRRTNVGALRGHGLACAKTACQDASNWQGRHPLGLQACC